MIGTAARHASPLKTRTLRCLAGLALGALMAGCSTASVYHIKVNGYTDPGTPALIRPGGSFCLMDNREAKNPLLEAEIKGKITKLLETRGYPVTTYEKADYCLFFAYGLGEPRSASAAPPEYYGGVGWGVGYGWGGPSLYFGVPVYGGYTPDNTTLYDRWLLISVVEGPAYRAQKAPRPVWVGEARSVGTSSDLRTVLNYLLVADFQEFGKNTGKALSREIKADNPEIYSLTH